MQRSALRLEEGACILVFSHSHSLSHGHIVYDRNLVSVLATETKIKSRYRFRGQNFFCLNLNFLPFQNLPKIHDLKDKEQHLDSQDDTDI